MKTIKVIFDNNDYLITRINGTVEEIERYYLNKKLCFLDDYDDTEKLQYAIKIEFLDEE